MTTLTSAQLDAIEAAWSSWQAAEYPSDETEPRQVVLDAIPALIAAARLALAAQELSHGYSPTLPWGLLEELVDKYEGSGSAEPGSDG